MPSHYPLTFGRKLNWPDDIDGKGVTFSNGPEWI